MTRKHYNLIADTLRTLVLDGTLDPIAAARVAGALGDSLELNQNFDRQRFVEQALQDLDTIGDRHAAKTAAFDGESYYGWTDEWSRA